MPKTSIIEKMKRNSGSDLAHTSQQTETSIAFFKIIHFKYSTNIPSASFSTYNNSPR